MTGREADRSWDVEYTPEFGRWWDEPSVDEQVDVGATIDVLARRGPALGFPFSSQVRSSSFGVMRELRIQHAGRPCRVPYAFDHRRIAVLLGGGEKSGDGRWYTTAVRRADALFRQHLDDLRGQ